MPHKKAKRTIREKIRNETSVNSFLDDFLFADVSSEEQTWIPGKIRLEMKQFRSLRPEFSTPRPSERSGRRRNESVMKAKAIVVESEERLGHLGSQLTVPNQTRRRSL